MQKVVVLDTNVLLADPQALLSFPRAEVVIPETVLGELDKLKTSRVDADLRFRGREVSRLLFEFSEEGSLTEGVDLPEGGRLRVAPFDSSTPLPEGVGTRNADDRILATVYQVLQQAGPRRRSDARHQRPQHAPQGADARHHGPASRRWVRRAAGRGATSCGRSSATRSRSASSRSLSPYSRRSWSSSSSRPRVGTQRSFHRSSSRFSRRSSRAPRRTHDPADQARTTRKRCSRWATSTTSANTAALADQPACRRWTTGDRESATTSATSRSRRRTTTRARTSHRCSSTPGRPTARSKRSARCLQRDPNHVNAQLQPGHLLRAGPPRLRRRDRADEEGHRADRERPATSTSSSSRPTSRSRSSRPA